MQGSSREYDLAEGVGVYNRRNVPGSTRFSLWPCEEAHEGMISPRGVGDIYNVPNATRFSLWRCEESHEGMISPRGVGDNESMLQVPRDFLFDDMRKLTRVWYRQLHWINPTFVFWLSYAWEILGEMTRNIGPHGRCGNYLGFMAYGFCQKMPKMRFSDILGHILNYVIICACIVYRYWKNSINQALQYYLPETKLWNVKNGKKWFDKIFLILGGTASSSIRFVFSVICPSQVLV